MDCKLIQAELIAYEIGTIDEEARATVEAHLLECTDCLKTYMKLKRHLAQGAESTERPSPHVRKRVRDDVEVMFRPTPIQRLRRWLTRPVPLYQGFATAAFATAVIVVTPMLRGHLRSAGHTPQPEEQARIDTSRVKPENLTIY